VYLLYCIFYSSELQRQSTLTGVGDQPVFPVAINGICAAVSKIDDAHLTPDVPRIMAYKKVIESFHNHRTVIPMRYGCVLRERPQVIQLLKRNARQYESLLKELDGCVEMGIRLIIDDYHPPWCDSTIDRPYPCSDPEDEVGELQPPKTGPGQRLSFENLTSHDPASSISGKTYLAARKKHYAQEECTTQTKNAIAAQFRTAFAGLFVKYNIETTAIANQQSPTNNQLVSLYFLVPGKSIHAFRRVFRNMRRRLENAKLLLSGPWPPYNFVLPDNEHHRPELSDEEAKKR
jgi:glycosyltransferase involved in cell wall biosynthesis